MTRDTSDRRAALYARLARDDQIACRLDLALASSDRQRCAALATWERIAGGEREAGRAYVETTCRVCDDIDAPAEFGGLCQVCSDEREEW